MFRVVFAVSAFVILVSAATLSRAGQQAPSSGGPAWLEPLRANADRLMKEAQADQFAWNRLAELTDTYGNRLAGSENLTRAIAWAVETMKKDGLENVHTEKVMVPKWVRGVESARNRRIRRVTRADAGPRRQRRHAAGGHRGRRARRQELRRAHSAQAADAKGKIVLFNAPFTSYGQTVMYRTGGASAAAPARRRRGARARGRSDGPAHAAHRRHELRRRASRRSRRRRSPPKTPTACSASSQRGRARPRAPRMEAHFDPDAESANVIGEIRGREMPDEIVLVGGHFDSWDVGMGASDDGVGCIVTWEAAASDEEARASGRAAPCAWCSSPTKRTACAAATRIATRMRKARSSTCWRSNPIPACSRRARLGFTGPDAAQSMMRDIGTLLTSLGMQDIGPGGGGADIGPIAQAGKVPMLAYQGDSNRYFTIHHTPADTVRSHCA